MLGIILTLVAVFLVMCIAFYFSDSLSERGRKADVLFYIRSKRFGRNSGRDHRQDPEKAVSVFNRKS